MFWPFKRLRTCSPGIPVHADVTNELQDAIIYHRHGEITAPVTLGLALPTSGWVYDTQGWRAPTSGGSLHFPVPFASGTDIMAITTWWNTQGRPFDTSDPYDYLGLSIEHSDPFVFPWTGLDTSPSISDTSTGDHDRFQVRITWDLRENPVHLRHGYFYRLRVNVGRAARRIDGLMATIARK